jgi:hypothetical protein
VKRLLRATARYFSPHQGNDAIMVEPYHKQMQILLDIQLQFETLKDEVEINPAFSSENADLETLKEPLKRNLGCIEEYLNEIVDEYEKFYKVHQSSDPTLSLSKLPKLGEFIGKPTSESDIRKKFIEPVHRIMEALLHHLTSE